MSATSASSMNGQCEHKRSHCAQRCSTCSGGPALISCVIPGNTKHTNAQPSLLVVMQSLRGFWHRRNAQGTDQHRLHCAKPSHPASSSSCTSGAWICTDSPCTTLQGAHLQWLLILGRRVAAITCDCHSPMLDCPCVHRMTTGSLRAAEAFPDLRWLAQSRALLKLIASHLFIQNGSLYSSEPRSIFGNSVWQSYQSGSTRRFSS